jgi:hypothetical protein
MVARIDPANGRTVLIASEQVTCQPENARETPLCWQDPARL